MHEQDICAGFQLGLIVAELVAQQNLPEREDEILEQLEKIGRPDSTVKFVDSQDRWQARSDLVTAAQIVYRQLNRNRDDPRDIS